MSIDHITVSNCNIVLNTIIVFIKSIIYDYLRYRIHNWQNQTFYAQKKNEIKSFTPIAPLHALINKKKI